ncbi:hypothetical protein [Dysgonomonas capnocytophagoides]|uniref:hypothetical protein n=1 Tax=Dysgonomonas capnocytophagoides TaxID=45254 RepID=UPI002589B329|nr:hypothetical protein [uncultured Dysgonomonas sp.]BES59904.1 hypothetical protein DCPSUM001_01480 [Dysgonomonas capnocytophagoides]
MATILKIEDLNDSLEFGVEAGSLTIKTFKEDENNNISKISEVQLDDKEVRELIDFLVKRASELS